LDRRSGHFRILMRQIAGFLGLQAVALAGLLGVGGWLVIERQLTLGQLIAAELVVALIVSGVAKLGKHLELYYDLLAAVDKVGYLTDLPTEQTEGEVLPHTTEPAAVEIRALSFASTGRRSLFDGLNLRIAPGRSIGFLANRGRGKSTLFEMICALESPDAGSILVDGLDVREIDKTVLRSQVMLVDDVEVFDGTVLDNVSLSPSSSRLEVRHALESAGLMAGSSPLPDGMDTRLSSGGQPLSRRQATRLMFARALVARPRVLLIDESLDRMGDFGEDESLLDALFAKESPWTLLVVSSNAEVLRRCDEVYELVGGSLTRLTTK